ncbi:MAG: hypothetical protein HY658_02800 [Actinobacteria bacterium]|nr:hypothetical protein [Actinomycetota bacterium]
MTIESSAPWELDQGSITRAIAEWRRRDNPDRDLRLQVGDWILDRLRGDPLGTGEVERAENGGQVRWARAGADTDVGVLFVVDANKRRVSVALIKTGVLPSSP